MIIFCDGGYKYISEQRSVVSWGIVVESDDLGTEISGALFAPSAQIAGMHEHFAFIQAVAFAAANNIQPKDVTFYCDAENIVFASQTPGHLQAFDRTLDKISKYFSPITIACAKRYIRESRSVKVKGHGNCVNNMRADFLASAARDKATGEQKYKFLDFTDWLTEVALGQASLQHKGKYIPAMALLFGTQPAVSV